MMRASTAEVDDGKPLRLIHEFGPEVERLPASVCAIPVGEKGIGRLRRRDQRPPRPIGVPAEKLVPGDLGRRGA